jgi:hypothetical protein
MAAPNLISATTITGKTALSQLTTATANVITNAAASGTVVKLNTVALANYTGNAVSSNVMINRSSITYYLGGSVVIPANSTLVLLAKDTTTYLEEGDVLQANVTSNTSVSMSASYELIAG